MKKILVVGNIVKDIYLNLDARIEKFEEDEKGVSWLNLGFNETGHKFFRRHSVVGGAAISLEVLKKMGCEVEISGAEVKTSDDGVKCTGEVDYRYILVFNEQTTYFSPSKRRKTKFIVPKMAVDYIYVDRSAELDAEEMKKIEGYIEMNPTKLIVYEKDFLTKKLVRNAELVIREKEVNEGVEQSLKDNRNTVDKVLELTEKAIFYQGLEEKIQARRLETITHLSFYSILAGTVIGNLVNERNARTALVAARINAERSNLDETLSLSDIEKIAKNSEYWFE